MARFVREYKKSTGGSCRESSPGEQGIKKVGAWTSMKSSPKNMRTLIF